MKHKHIDYMKKHRKHEWYTNRTKRYRVITAQDVIDALEENY